MDTSPVTERESLYIFASVWDTLVLLDPRHMARLSNGETGGREICQGDSETARQTEQSRDTKTDGRSIIHDTYILLSLV